MPSPAEQFSLFKTALIQHREWLKVLIAFSAAINLLALTPSIYMLQVYDRVLNSQSHSTLVALTGLIIGLYLLGASLEHYRTTMLTRIGNALERKFITSIHTAAFQRALKTQGKDNTGQAIRDFAVIRQFMTSQGATALFDTPWVLIYVVLLFIFHPLFGAMALCGMAISIGLSWIHLRSNKHHEEQSNTWAMRSANTVNSTLRNTNSIQAMGILPAIQTKWLEVENQHSEHHTVSSDATSRWTQSNKYFRMFVQSAALGLGAYLALEHTLTGGMMIAASILMGKALAPIDVLASACKSFVSVRQAHERISALITNSPAVEKLHPLPTPKPDLEFQNVYVCAPTSTQWVLKNIHLHIPAGSAVGVIGPSGSGKTSFLHTLATVMPVAQGRLNLDGAEISRYERSQLGPWTGYLSQQIELFEGTVAQNIARFEESDDGFVLEAATAAGIHELILKLPKGYDTLLGAQGEGLSGGMKQRIGLARALYKKPQLLLLDEPNSNLDTAGEAALMKTILQHRQQGNTTVLVTHKKSILRACNKLLVLNEGEVTLYGNTQEVLERLQPKAAKHTLELENG